MWSMRVEHSAPVGPSTGLKVYGSALVCNEESHPDVSWGAGGWPLEAVLQNFEDLLYVFLFFLSLIQWFDTAPSRTCPQCRTQVSKRHIINKLFFDVTLEEQAAPDAETLQNELDKVKAQLSLKEKEKRECQAVVDGLRDTLDVRNATIESLQKVVGETEMLCSSLKKQMKFLEQQQEDNRSSKEEARRLRNKLRTMERIELLLQSQRSEVEEMIKEMGVGQAAVEQLAIYCVSLKKEYENLKEARKISGEMTEKLKKELFSVNNKLQKATSELEKTKEELKSTQKDLKNADKEILSLKKKIDILQDTLKVPSVTRETLSRLVFESPVPVELQHPKLHRPSDSDEINLDATYDVDTPEHQPCTSPFGTTKRQKLDKKPPPVVNLAKKVLKETVENRADDLEDDALKGLLPAYIRNSVLSKKPSLGSLWGPHKNMGSVRTGYDGMGGRTKFIEPTNLAEIRPLSVRSKKKVSRPASAAPSSSSSGSSQSSAVAAALGSLAPGGTARLGSSHKQEVQDECLGCQSESSRENGPGPAPCLV
ncbi:PREDICTED: E3 ubiquitin-protein ligase TRAIP [Corvus brachyrhynchos]|uniref:E3 ubiquitin-protein ligase TRAIP n=1 Tax=Corvus brachyrhynchos TaxID=85066 RepID=UPI00081636DF|nr:PREDICTED: E3 ubiquitin-protein ligase TRAIP [Corvus brachyrhynchos]